MDLSVPYRLTIGVVGRGGAENDGELRRAAGEVLDQILLAHRGLTRAKVRVCVLSTLGAGAESVVVDELLERGLDTTLKAVLPLTPAEYLEDFKTDAERSELGRLLARARARCSPERAPLGAEYPAQMVPEARRAAHAEAMKLIVRCSDVVIALGGRAGAAAEGAAAVPFALMEKERVPHFAIDPENPGAIQPPPAGWADGTLAREIEAFNRRVAELEPDPAYFQNSFDSIFNNPALPPGPPEDVAQRIRDHLVPSYVAVSSLAKKYQRIYRRTGLTVFWLAFGIVGLVSCGVIFFESSHWVFLAEFLLLLLISRLIVRAGKKKASHRNWVEHRFLAERIRSGVFFAACGAEVQTA